MSHIAVIGAGITGITTAYALASRGHAVTVIDRHRYAAMETSFANGGQPSASNAEVWNNLGTVVKGMKWMLRKDAPLLLNPSPSYHKYSWMTEFLFSIPKYRENTIATTKLAIEARHHLFSLAEKEGIEFDLERRGILHIYRTKPEFDKAGKTNELLRQGGLDRRPVTPAEITQIEPTIKGTYFGGFFTPSDSTGDIHKFTRGLAEACARRGVKFLYQADVEAIEHGGQGVTIHWRPSAEAATEGTATAPKAAERLTVDSIVICAGIASRRFAAMLGDRVNIYPVKGYSITVHLDDVQSQDAAPTVSLLDDATK